MRAVTYHRYGPPEVLSVSDLPKPVPKDDEVLIRVRASSLNSWDWDLLVGSALGRIGGPFRPPYTILGADVAGVVEAVGANVTRFAPGDAVMGDLSESGWGALAEYVCARAPFLTIKPEGLSFEEAAAIPQAGGLALQGLRDRSQVAPGKSVLVNGAGGGMGSFAVQIAKHLGAEVTGVDHGDKLAFMRALGADHVLDYREVDFTRTGRCYDLILDAVARRPAARFARALNPGGALVVVGGTIPALLGVAVGGRFVGKKEGKSLGVLVWRSRGEDFAALAGMAVRGEIRPAVDKVYPLAETPEAFRRIGAGAAKGKLVIRVD